MKSKFKLNKLYIVLIIVIITFLVGLFFVFGRPVIVNSDSNNNSRFEAVMDGNVLFSGNDIISIKKDTSLGFGLQLIDKQNDIYAWTLPFILSTNAALRFAKMTFHKCTPTGNVASDSDYDCSKTYFFIDRPVDSIIIMDNELYLEEQEVPIAPEMASQFIPIKDVLNQVTSSYYVINPSISNDQLKEISADFDNYKKAIVSPGVSETDIKLLMAIGYKVTIIKKDDNESWIWSATGLKSIVSITPGIANMGVSTIDSPEFKTFSQLTITGNAKGIDLAKESLSGIIFILENNK